MLSEKKGWMLYECIMKLIIVSVSVKTHIARTSMQLIKAKILNFLHICHRKIHTGEGSFKSTKAITILLAWLWRICSLKVKGVECICLQCSKHKLNHYLSFGKLPSYYTWTNFWAITLWLAWSANHWWTFQVKSQHWRHFQTTVMSANIIYFLCSCGTNRFSAINSTSYLIQLRF